MERPDPKVIAQQLRKPSGAPAARVGDKMDRVNEPLFDLVLGALQPADGERILEIGFGTGAYIPRLFERSSGVQVHGIDYSPDMLSVATRNNAEWVDGGQLSLSLGTSDALPFEDGFFDKVFCNMLIYFWDEPEEHLREVHRVLEPGGHFYTGMRTKESMLQFPFVQHGFALFETEEWMKVLANHGFEPREAARQLDPPLDDEDGNIRLESVCIEARKL